MGCTSHAPRRSETAVCSGVGGVGDGRIGVRGGGGAMGEGGGGDGIIALGKMDIWVCEARYHAKQHEKWRRKKKCNKIKECIKIKARLQPKN